MAFKSKPAVTRPANTTAYTAGDVVGGVIEFGSLPRPNALFITSADLRIDVSAIPSGMTTFRLHLYDATPPSALADNAAWDLPSGDRANYLGFVDYGTLTDTGSTLYCRVDQANVHVGYGSSGNTSLFGYLVTTGAYTPAANSEVYNPGIYGITLD